MQELFDPETNPGTLYATLDRRPRYLQTDPHRLSDTFFAYRTPQLVLQINERKGFIKCLNLEDVCKTLRVPSPILFAYLAVKLKARSRLQDFRLRGEHCLLLQNVSNTLVRFIVQWVLCIKCRLPELQHTWEKSRVQCCACGWKGILSSDPDFSAYLTYTHEENEKTRFGVPPSDHFVLTTPIGDKARRRDQKQHNTLRINQPYQLFVEDLLALLQFFKRSPTST